ncbi:mycofactocin biosynthesis peptidyl-dipeptidase MftE [Gordonia sp. HNM0687]|uniref:Mycofactocin biosynthesis peptidyl-dipeptidase MftE n=1 Tax=Gordonia mangrovi TaxID=2665643 RepID=A0A6L7GP53_9ACTN|nr:mycofactocin biosynthesis peptidyl-dipeptidase MftE [Gordonia mangrovi]MXP20465.1 mycofactocin biosynthesis peptidyl-dipeptidase MftE [Gordonia mangrovi]UVF78939.1 mycofactocin biosynthesis peptidyl-dipeptidase MftE [Gordonia mangrovi]
MERRAALGQMSWPELSEATVTLLVPLGATEQHGPHLPLDTDTRIAQAVAERVAALDHQSLNGPVTTVLTAPALNYGASGEHEGFPGTISLGHDALELLLLEFGRSACRWADRLLFVNGHGGNAGTLATAVRRLRYEGRDAAWFPCAFPAADAHAGHTETSVLLHFSPSAVTVSAAQAGNTAPVEALLPAMRTGGVAAVSANGVLGDPTGASGDHGAQLLDALVASLGAALVDWRVGESGRLG